MNEVVARYADGRLVKGTSLDVAPAKPRCHIKTEDGVVEVELKDLKALYFVKDLGGNPEHHEAMEPEEGDIRLRGTKPIEVHFDDGERLVGRTNRFPPVGNFFFVLPVDVESNNVRILVNRLAVESISEAP